MTNVSLCVARIGLVKPPRQTERQVVMLGCASSTVLFNYCATDVNKLQAIHVCRMAINTYSYENAVSQKRNILLREIFNNYTSSNEAEVMWSFCLSYCKQDN